MSGGNSDERVPAICVLRRAGGEAADPAARLLELEEAACEVLARGAGLPAAAKMAQLQAFDVLGQRLHGLSDLLQAVADSLAVEVDVPVMPLMRILPLEWQRDTLLLGPRPAACLADQAVELF